MTRVRSRLARAFVTGPASVIAAPVLVLLPSFFSTHAPAPGDGFGQYIPWFTMVGRSWRHLQLPVWDPYSFSGFPLLANHQSAAFYPPTLLFGFLHPTQANNAILLVTLIVAATGARALALAVGADAVGASVAGVAFGLSGYFFGHLGHQSMIASTAWMPWALAAVAHASRRFTVGRVLACGPPIALSALAGHSQLFLLVVGVTASFALVATVVDWRTVGLRALAAAGAGIAIGAGIAAVQLGPTLGLLPHSARADLTYDEAIAFSMPASHTPLLVFPYLFGNSNVADSADHVPVRQPYLAQWNLAELSGYPGAATIVLAAVGLAALRRHRLAAAVALVGAGWGLVALGPSGPFSHLVHAIPVYGQVRAWARYLSAVDLAVAVVAGIGVTALRGARSRRTEVVAIAAAAGVVAVGVALPHVHRVARWIPRGIPWWFVIGVPCLFAVASAALAVVTRRRPALAGVLVALVAVDLVASFGASFEWRTTTLSRAEVDGTEGSHRAVWGTVADAPGGIDRFFYVGLVPPPGTIPLNTTHAHLRSANGNDPLAPTAYTAVAAGMFQFGGVGEPASLWAPGSDVLDLLRVSTVLVDLRRPEDGPPPGGAARRAGGAGGVARFEYEPKLPDAWLVGAVDRAPRPAVVAAVRGERPFDPSTVALVERACGRCPAGTPGRAGTVVDRRWSPSRFDADVVADRSALLVVSQAWLPGWRATIDGRAAGEALRADAMLQAVPVPPGRHHVTLAYRPPGLLAGAAVSGATILGCIAALVGSRVIAIRRRVQGRR